MSLRSLARNSALYTVGNVAPKLGAFLLLPIYLHFLTPADYGTVALLTSFAGILVLLYHLGADSALMRLHFETEGRGRARLYATVGAFTLALSALATVGLALVLGPFFEQAFAGTPFIPLGLLALLIAFAGALTYVPSVLLRANAQAGRFLALNLGAFALNAGASVVLLWLGFGPAAVLGGQLLASSAVMALALGIVVGAGADRFDRGALGEALRLGLPIVPHAVAGWALRLADRWLIVLLIGLPAVAAREQAGIYAVGYQLGYVVSIILISFNAAWSPYFYLVGDRPAGPAFHTHMTTLVVAGLLALAVGLSTLAPELVAAMTRPGYERAADVLPIVAFASVLHGLYTMFVTVVFLTKRTARLALITMVAALLNVALNVTLIPVVGILGAAWATLAAYAFFAGATFVYARGMYPIRVDWPRMAALASVAVATVIASRALAPSASVTGGVIHAGLALLFVAVAVIVCGGSLQRLRLVSRQLLAERATA